AGLVPQKAKVIFQPLIVLAALDQIADFLVEGLDADLELERAPRKLRDHRAQGFGQPVGDHFKMEEMSGLIAFEEEFQDGPADGEVEVERAIHELELRYAAIEQPLQVFQQERKGRLPHG